MITQERLQELLHYAPETGVFTWLVSKGKCRAGAAAGCANHDGYWRMRIDGADYQAHRLAWLCVTGGWPVDQIDHINGVRADNRFINLREATNAENAQNQAMAVNNTSGFTGVSWNRGARKWQSHITFAGKLKNLGYFATPQDAHAAHVAAKAKHHTFQPTMRAA